MNGFFIRSLGRAMLGFSVALASPLLQAGSPAQAQAPAAAAVAPAPAKAEAEVRRVEAATGRIQLRHGYIANLDMPPMTMVFRVQNPGLLDGLKEGDRILFTAEKIDGGYVVTSVEKRP